MKLTKFGHSCLYIELETTAALIDPGVFSTVPVDELARLDHIFITHEHADHCDLEVLKKLHAKFPNATVTGPADVAADLKDAGITASTAPPSAATLFHAPHERIDPFGADTPDEIGVHIAALLTHPGDSHSFSETMPVLALPITAPWGSTRRAVELALELRPKAVVPIHDWFLSDPARIWYYARLKEVLEAEDIQFIGLAAGESAEINESELLQPGGGQVIID